MVIIVSMFVVSAVIHLAWIMRRRTLRYPAIGTKWGYSTYMKRYVAEVVSHHPLNNEITVIRYEDGNPLASRTYMRVDPEKFMSSVTPYKEKR